MTPILKAGRSIIFLSIILFSFSFRELKSKKRYGACKGSESCEICTDCSRCRYCKTGVCSVCLAKNTKEKAQPPEEERPVEEEIPQAANEPVIKENASLNELKIFDTKNSLSIIASLAGVILFFSLLILGSKKSRSSNTKSAASSACSCSSKAACESRVNCKWAGGDKYDIN